MRHKAHGPPVVWFVFVLLIAAGLACGPAATPEPPPPEPAPPVEIEEPAGPDPTTEPAFMPELLARVPHEPEDDAGDVWPVGGVAFSPDGDLFASGIFLDVRLWSVPDAEPVRSIEHRHSIDSLVFSPDGSRVVAAQSMYGVQISGVDDGEALFSVDGSYDSRSDISPDGTLIASGNRDGVVRLWSAVDGEPVTEFEAPDAGWLTSIAFSPDGELVAAGHLDGAVNLWRVADSTLAHALEPVASYQGVVGLAFSPDSRLLAIGSREGFSDVVTVWDVASGTLMETLPGFDSAVNSVAFSPDGELLAASANDGFVLLWQVSDWSLLHRLEHLTDDAEVTRVMDIAFSPSGRKLVAGTWDGYVWLWKVQPG